MTRVAVLGTGIMGAPMARRLAEAGHDVVAWNRTSEKAQGLGATLAETPAAAVEGAEVVLTMLADGPAVEKVIVEALPAMADDAIWAQTSTVGLEAAERLASLAAERGVAQVDAPVLGTRKPAEEGQLVVLGAGPEDLRPRCEELFSSFSRATHWVGERAPAAQALKLVINSWILNSIENIAETVALAQGLGVDPQRFLDAISGGAMDMQYAHLKTAAILAGDFEPMFKLALAHKDAGLVIEAAKGAGVEPALVQTTRDQMARAIDLGHAEDDFTAVYFASRAEA